MRFTELSLAGVYVIDVEERADSRGFFARRFCAREFAAHGLATEIVQTNLSLSFRAGTIRGLHYQRHPSREAKHVRCVAGAIWDVVVDLRPNSPTYLRSVGVELTAANRRAIYVPAACAHGYQTLVDDSSVEYDVFDFYAPDLEGGLRHDDPRLGVEWPLRTTEISDKDLAWSLIDSDWTP